MISLQAIPSRFREPIELRMVRRVAIGLALLHVVMASQSSYRAWVQIRSLALLRDSPVLAEGTLVGTDVVSWARTWVHVRLEVEQDGRTELLATRVIPSNHEASWDPRWRRGSIRVRLDAATLARLHPGRAVLRAHAVGGPQWLRTPPPLVRELPVIIVASR